MFIPMSMAINNDASVPEGHVEKECRICHTRFSIPEAEAETYKNNVCENCEPEFNKQVAEASAALMKNSSDAAQAIKTALGK